MKFICFGYLDVKNWVEKSPSEQNAMIDECFAYDEVLKKNGNWSAEKGSKAPTLPPPCAIRTARCPAPMALTPKPKSSWEDC